MVAFRHLPTSEFVEQQLQEVTATFYDALDAGTLYAKSILAEGYLDFEPLNFSSIVRGYVLKLLKSRGFWLEHLPNNGICAYKLDYAIRVMKVGEGELPDPGASFAKKRFLQQNGQTHLPFVEPEFRIPFVNLVLAWDITPNHFLGDVRVICPVASDTAAGFEAHWEFPVQPTATASTTVLHPSDMESAPQADPYDDIIKLRSNSEETGE